VTEVSGFDLNEPSFVADPYPVFAELRAAGRALWHPELSMWLATRHADVDAVLRHRGLGRVFITRQGPEWETFNLLHSDSILDSEPPKHTRLRSLVAKAFTRSHVEALRPAIRQQAEQLLDQVDADEPFDIITALAEPLPVLVIADLLGVPEADRSDLRPWSQAIVKMYEYATTPQQQAAARQAADEFAGFVADLARHRAEHPGDDLLTRLVQVRDGSDRLSESELVATAVLLLNAGHEASVNGFGNGLVALLQRRGQWERLLREPSLVPTAVEEMLRFDSPLHLFERTAKVDVEVAGVTVRAGEKIAALLGSANRDPEVFAEADEFDVARDPNPHLAFGAGIHFCLGAPLARAEMQTSLELLLERFADLDLAGPPQARPTFVLRGFTSVPVSS
jgi:cytochrome P450